MLKEENIKSILLQDKLKHFLVCLVASILSTELAIGLAIGKEVGDYTSYGHFCLWDLVADFGGLVVGTAIRLGLMCLFGLGGFYWW